MNERVKKLRKERKLSQVKFAEMMGITQSVVSLIESGHTNVSVDVLRRVSEKFDVSIDWLIYGKDKYVKLSRDNSFIPLVNVEVKAGYIKGHLEDDFMDTLELYKIPGFERGYYRIFEVEGDSMIPSILPRDWIVCREANLEEMVEGSLCVVVTTRDVVVKRIYKDRNEPKNLVLKSDNTSYNDINIALTDVKEIWEVQAKITNSFVSSSMEQSKRMDDLENELKEIKGQLSQLLTKLNGSLN